MSGSTTPMVCGNTTYPSKPQSADGYTRTSTTAKYATLHPVYLNSSNPVCWWVNADFGGSAEDTAGVDVVRIKAAIVVGGVTTPLTFNGGALDATIATGAVQGSDPATGVSLTVGTNVLVITWVSAASRTGAWGAGVTLGFDLHDGQGWYAGAPEETTVTATGIQSSSVGGSGIAYCFSPFAVTATRSLSTRSVAIIGDSIASTVDSDGNKAFVVRALQAAGIPYTKLGVSGDSLLNIHLIYWDIRLACMTGRASDAICELGVNDILRGENNTTLKAWSLEAWTKIKAAVGGSVYQTTITPTIINTGVQLAHNQWILDGAPIIAGVGVAPGTGGATRAGEVGHPLTGILNTAVAVALDSTINTWNPTYYSGDGVHPNNAGVTVMAAALDTSKFLPLVDYAAATSDTNALLAEHRGTVAYV